MSLVPTHQVGDAAGSRAARIRKLIARKRSEKDRLDRDLARMAVEVAEVAALRRRRLDPLDDEIHGHFGFVLERGRFPRRTGAEILQLYQELMDTATISPRGDVDAACPCPRCTAEREGGDPWPGDDGSDAQAHTARRDDAEQARSMRDLYHELATRFHPDKARDDDTRAENERLMREINGAYHAGDVDTLAALSRELGFDVAGDGVLEALAAQYERLKAEVRALRNDGLGPLVVQTRRCERYGEPTPLEEIEADVHEHADHLERLAELFRALRAESISQDEFLARLLGDDDNFDDDEDLAADDFLALLTAVAEDLAAAASAPPPRKRNRQPKSQRQRRRRRGKKR